MKIVFWATIVVFAFIIGLFAFNAYTHKETLNSPSNVLNTESQTLPFVITDVAVPNSLKVGDGNPQTGEGLFTVTWKITGGENIDKYRHQADIDFGMVDENAVLVVGYFYGGGADATFRDGNRTLSMPPLCSSVPVDSCFGADEITPSKKYRIQAIGRGCDEKIKSRCYDPYVWKTEPAYSNWFTLSL